MRKSAERRSELGVFLKALRQRIDPDARDLGRYVRLPRRLGKRVTQEELAEAIGVSREWYASLETATPATRTSSGLLDRLADAVMVSPQERARLFQLALPELGRAQLREDSLSVFAAFSRLRSLSKRLWTASSVDDLLVTANEQLADWFDRSVFVRASRRREAGVWEPQVTDDKQGRNEVSQLIRELEDELLPTSEAIDALNLYPRLRNAGDVGGSELHPPLVRREILKLYARRRLPEFAFLCARLRTRGGVVGGLCISHEFGYSYSASDRAALGAFAEVASLALS